MEEEEKLSWISKRKKVDVLGKILFFKKYLKYRIFFKKNHKKISQKKIFTFKIGQNGVEPTPK